MRGSKPSAHERENRSDDRQALNTRSACPSPSAPYLGAMAARIPAGAETYRTHDGLIVIFRDGNSYLAVRPDWEDLQSSPTGTGNTPRSALDHLLAEEKRLGAPPR
jgi:hypothetical protein